MATDGDRSLSSGISLPMWVKNKMTDRTFLFVKSFVLTTIECGQSAEAIKRLDFDQSTFSPPEPDDNFLYIRYPRTTSEPKNTSLKSVTEQFAPNTSADSASNKIDFSKHTAPCQKFLSNLANQSVSKAYNLPPDTKIKSNGTDDGFKGEAAKCGKSVVRVASQMVSSKVTRGFFARDECDSPPAGFNPGVRRGSKSLPASPLSSPNTSPKSKKRLANKYFTGTFSESEKYQGSWLLSNLLGKRETISRSVDIINEEESKDDLTKSISTISINDESNTKSKSPKQVFKAKPSELREMNFWSPTSM